LRLLLSHNATAKALGGYFTCLLRSIGAPGVYLVIEPIERKRIPPQQA
jgi:hypothetical protein